MDEPRLQRRILIIAINAIHNGHKVPKRMQLIHTDLAFKNANRITARQALNRLGGLASTW